MLKHERHLFLEFIENNVLPDEDFILVLGTSHTWGECERGESKRLDFENIWSTKVSKYTNMPTVNLGLPGADNRNFKRILQILKDSKKFKDNCAFVILENRFGRDSFTVDTAAMISYVMQYTQSNRKHGLKSYIREIRQDEAFMPTLDEYLEMSDIDDKITSVYVKHDFLNQINRPSKTHYRFALTALPELIDTQIDDIVSTIQGSIQQSNSSGQFLYKDEFEEFSFTTLEHYKMYEYLKSCYISNVDNRETLYHKCVSELETIKLILDHADIPFVWFCMDNYTGGDHENKEDIFVEENDVKIYNYSQSFFTDIFDNEVLKCGAAYRYLMETGDLPERCDCGHYTEPFHNWIADKVYNEIKGEIHK